MARMPLSVTAPIQRAIDRTTTILFRPFHFEKWLTLGFCAFLAGLGNCSGGGSTSWSNSADFGAGRTADRTLDWIDEHTLAVIGIGALVLVVVVVIALVLIWLQARGRFMLLDGVVHDRGAVKAPWEEYRNEANGAFRFKLVVAGLTFIAFLLIGGLGLLLNWDQIGSGDFRPVSWGLFAVFGGVLALVGLAALLIDVFLDDFVVPAMYARRIGVMEGWAAVRSEVLAPQPGAVALYLGMKILIAIVSTAIVFALVIATFCTAACLLAIPYVGTVLLLPLIVFKRCYSLYFLEQLGGPWRLIPDAPVAPRPPEPPPEYERSWSSED